MNPELEKLIDLALADGQLTEKERQILFKKAQALGIDLDEFEMVLDGKLHLAQKAVTQSIPPPQKLKEQQTPSLSNKEGSLKKCPACGAPTQGFATKCSECGHDFRNIAANTSITSLFNQLNEIEGTRSSNILSNFGSALTKHMGVDKITNQKKSLISNFPIPNTKEDILEFLSLALPKAQKAGNFFTQSNEANKEHNDFVPTWRTKCEQIIMKARFSMKGDNRTLEEIEHYAKQLGIK